MTHSLHQYLPVQSLRKLTRETFEAFALNVSEPSSAQPQTLFVDELIRFLPGQRMVVKGRWHGKNVIAKIYIDRFKAKRQWREEINGIHYLQRSDIDTPSVLFQGILKPAACYLLIFAYVQHHVYIDRPDKRQSQTLPFLTDIISILARLHQADLIHNDCHRHNFLYTNTQTYTVDAADVKQVGGNKMVTFRRNLAVFFSSLATCEFRWFEELLQHYFDCYPAMQSYIEIKLFRTQIQKIRMRQRRKHMKKMLRSCSTICGIHTAKQNILYQREYTVLDIHQSWMKPQLLFADPTQLYLTHQVIKTSIGGKMVVIKRFLANQHRIKSIFGFHSVSSAQRSWLGAHYLAEHVVGMQPMAVMTPIQGNWRQYGYFMYEYIPGDTLSNYIQGASADTQYQVFIQIAAMLATLAEQHITHGNLRPEHIIINQQQAYLLSLEHVCWHSSVSQFEMALKHDLFQLCQACSVDSQVRSILDEALSQYF